MSNTQNTFKSDIISSLTFIILSILIIYYSASLPHTAAHFPNIIAIIMIIASFILFIKSFISLRLNYDKNKRTTKTLSHHSVWIRLLGVLIILSLSGMFILVLPIIGFEYAAFIFIASCIWLLGDWRAIKRYWYIPIVSTLLMSVLFRIALHVKLPVSFLPF